MNKKVSIIIPVYNGSDYMKYAIDSALSQTYKNIEIIVVNDGSNDNGKTRKIAKEYGNKIRYFEKKNGGVSTALNLAIKNMKGQYFSWLSHDDEYYPTKIEEQVKEIEGTDKTIIMSDYCTIDEHGNKISEIRLNKNKIEKNSYYPIFEGKLNGITLLIPKKAFNESGEFDESLKCTQDYDLWFKMLKAGYKFKHVPKALAKSRQHRNQTTYLSPNTIREGNKLWIRLVNSITEKDKSDICSSQYEFYLWMLKKMYLAGYNGAYKYIKNIIINDYPQKKFSIIIYDISIRTQNKKNKITGILKRTKQRTLKENYALFKRKVLKKCKK